jgi:hypothetical protein
MLMRSKGMYCASHEGKKPKRKRKSKECGGMGGYHQTNPQEHKGSREAKLDVKNVKGIKYIGDVTEVKIG